MASKIGPFPVSGILEVGVKNGCRIMLCFVLGDPDIARIKLDDY